LNFVGQTCSAQTNSGGVASCHVTPGAVGLLPVTASYAGNGRYTNADAANVFDATVGTPVNTSQPAISGTPQPGNVLTCSHGSWSNNPTRFSFSWNRDGKPIAGATAQHYTVQITDEAHTLTCVVTASNSLGSGPKVASASLLVALPGTLSCAKPSGRLSGTSLGPLKLGLTRARARKTLKRFGVTYNNMDNFCLYAGWGIRAGYPSSKLLRSLSASQRKRVKDKIILMLTANPFYALSGTRPGTKLTKKLSRHLRLGPALKIGANDWYLSPGKSGDGVLKVRGGIIQEVGIADRQLLGTRAAQKLLLNSFNAAKP
jgi:hypothetical protein